MKQPGTLVDTSALIYLAKADVFREAHVSVGVMLAPPAVWEESVEAGVTRGLSDTEVILRAQDAGWVRTIAIASGAERLARDAEEALAPVAAELGAWQSRPRELRRALAERAGRAV